MADLRGSAGDAPPPPPGVQILSISCSFWEILTNSYVGAPLGSWRPLLGEILDPLLLQVCQSSLMLIIEAKKYFHGHNNYNIAISVTFYLLEGLVSMLVAWIHTYTLWVASYTFNLTF